ncbi:MAG: serine hydrolase domain-containing protein [Gemmatimonadaceae bacterium]
MTSHSGRRLGIAVVLTAAALTRAPALAAQVMAGYAVAGGSVEHAGAIARARAFIADSMAKANVPGVSVAVAIDGEIVWSEGFGFADVEQHVPVTPLTRLRIGSVSKSLTAAAVGLLVQEGRLDLDAPVQRYVPSFPRKGHEITTRLVAGHLAGIRHYRGDEFLSQQHYDNVLAGLAIFQDDSLLSEPGTRFSYSTYAWNLVSAIVEGAAGEPFLTYMHSRVLEPLGMRHTVAEHPDSIIEYRADFYTLRDGEVINARYVDNSYKWAGGGFLSTTEDLARFGTAHLEPGFLEQATLSTLFTSQRTRDGEATGNGIGWFVGTDDAGRDIVWHSGGSVGGTAYLILYPEQRVVVAMLANADVSFVGSARRVAGYFFAQ